jgi:DHA2 family methylenomycin A resistance protein-like MFS transporter
MDTAAAEAADAKPSAGRVPDAPHARIVIAIASMGFFLITLDISIVNVALARIRAELGGGTTGQQWMIDGYTLLFAALLLFAGNLSDRIGAKRALALGIAIFALTSAACAAAPSTGLLIAARCAQGAGAAIMLPASMALVREAFPDPGRRARALGVWAVGGAVAGLVGQPLGGLLTTFNWRWVFTINLPVCVAILAFLAAVAKSPTRPAKFDWAGQILAVVGLATLVYGLIDGGHTGFGSPPVVLALAIAVLAVTGFVIVQSRWTCSQRTGSGSRFRSALRSWSATTATYSSSACTSNNTSACHRGTPAWSSCPQPSSRSPATWRAGRSRIASAPGSPSSPVCHRWCWA